MKIGDTIITKGGNEYSIDSFINIKDKSGVKLKAINGSNREFYLMKDYLNFYIGVGVYTIKRKNNVVKKLRRRHHLRKSKGKKSCFEKLRQ